jgi:hypothetical protein
LVSSKNALTRAKLPKIEIFCEILSLPKGVDNATEFLCLR